MLDCLGPALLTGKGCLLSVLDYLGPAAETGFGPFRLVVKIDVGVFEPMRLRRFDVGGRLGIVWTMEGYWILHWVMGGSPFGLVLGQVGSVGRGLA